MYAKMGTDNRITVAKRLLTRLVDSLKYQDELELALRVYGHQSLKTERNCKDTRLEVPFDFYEDFHIYGLLWMPDELVWYLDGKEVFRRKNDFFTPSFSHGRKK